jgi:hypothetical protein
MPPKKPANKPANNKHPNGNQKMKDSPINYPKKRRTRRNRRNSRKTRRNRK